MTVEIHTIPAFSDNYLWLLGDPENGTALVVDPGDAGPIQTALDRLGLRLGAMLTTHHHADHVGGVSTLVEAHGCPVHGPRSPHIPQVTHPVREGDELTLLGLAFTVIEVPGHTLDHIAYFCARGADGHPWLFCGDTLFAAGCGRLFEGSPAQMSESLSKLANLPADTRVYCAHEYTLSNLRFALAVEPDNRALQARQARVARMRDADIPSVPSTLEEELATNPFLRCHQPAVRQAAADRAGMPSPGPVETLAAIRQWKDNFR